MDYLLSGRWSESGQVIKWNAYTYCLVWRWASLLCYSVQTLKVVFSSALLLTIIMADLKDKKYCNLLKLCKEKDTNYV